jgi:hypothetical protein
MRWVRRAVGETRCGTDRSRSTRCGVALRLYAPSDVTGSKRRLEPADHQGARGRQLPDLAGNAAAALHHPRADRHSGLSTLRLLDAARQPRFRERPSVLRRRLERRPDADLDVLRPNGMVMDKIVEELRRIRWLLALSLVLSAACLAGVL